MKKMILAAVLTVAFSFGAFAQNRSIDFEETKVWTEIVAKAKAEKKLIFIDCYTDWCGPCKQLAANVFTQDKVADFFNENFVNAKYEMEKDADGIANKEKWTIAAYPTLIFVDPTTETVVHKLVGAGQADWLIEGGQIAMDPAGNMNSMIERYNKGERSPEFVAKYLKALKAAYMSELQEQVAEEYLNNLTADQMATAENWLLLRDNVSDPLSKPLRVVMANRQKFYDIEGLGQQNVDRFLSIMIDNAAVALAHGQTGRGEFDQARYDELYSYLKGLDYPAKTSALTWMESSEFVGKGDWDGLMKRMKEVESAGTLDGGQFANYHQYFIETIAMSNNDAMIDSAIADLDKRIAAVEGEDTNAWFKKAGFADSKYRILSRAGRELAADNAKLEKEEYEKKGKDASGGNVMRAIRMG